MRYNYICTNLVLMTVLPNIEMSAYNYDLPDERIAKYPLEQRDQSKLLLYKEGTISESTFSSIVDYLPSGSLLLYNNTKVLHARLVFRKETGAKIEIFCLEPHDPIDHQIALQTSGKVIWKCLVGNAKKWKEGNLKLELNVKGKTFIVTASKVAKEGNATLIAFTWNENYIFFADILEAVGKIPIPPYLNREAEEKDEDDYQTVYAKHKGSVAAPTAGLHFTGNVLTELSEKQVGIEELTLHVGAGTFQPVKSETIEGHKMHSEIIEVQIGTIESIIKHLGEVTAVGTTSVRTLESLYWMGVQVLQGREPQFDFFRVEQWEPYRATESLPSSQLALQSLFDYLTYNKIVVVKAATEIIIVPGYEFRVVNRLVTNFHQPGSTLLLLVSAFVKGNWSKIYDYALQNSFRFLSYGDSSLLFRS